MRIKIKDLKIIDYSKKFLESRETTLIRSGMSFFLHFDTISSERIIDRMLSST